MSSNSRNDIILSYPNGDKIAFDRRTKTRDGWIAGIDVISNHDEIANLARQTDTKSAAKEGKGDKKRKAKPQDVMKYHQSLGHPGEALTRSTAAARGIPLQGSWEPCEDCLVGKAHAKRISKDTVPRSKVVGERIFLDISSPQYRSLGGNKHWLLLLDDCTDHCWSFFMKTKDRAADLVFNFVQKLDRLYGIQVKYICLDNSGKNLAI